MKLHFEPDLDYQKLAIESVADLFRGQEINRTEFTVTRRPMADRAGQTEPRSRRLPRCARANSAWSKASSASATG